MIETTLTGRSQARAIVPFLALFFLLWTIAVVVVWKQGLMPESLRPAFRAVFWLGAAIAWVTWIGIQRPLRTLGLVPVTLRTLVLSLMSAALVTALNYARVRAAGGNPTVPSIDVGAVEWAVAGVVEEELIFRGVVQSALLHGLPTVIALLTTGVAFLAIHFPGWLILGILPDPGTIVSVLAIGLVCGLLRFYCRSLWPAISAHLANNLGAAL